MNPRTVGVIAAQPPRRGVYRRTGEVVEVISRRPLNGPITVRFPEGQVRTVPGATVDLVESAR